MAEDDRPTSWRAAVRTADALPAGTRIARYKIGKVLRRDAFGITYRARDMQLERDVSIREYLPTHFAARQVNPTVEPRSVRLAGNFLWGRDRFLAEARSLAGLADTPGIVNISDCLEANGTAYLVMAPLRDETLAAALARQGRLSPQAVERLLPPLLDGLERVHAAGLLHLDITPSNIVLDDQGHPTLFDFGAARAALAARMQSTTVFHTPGYAAIEQFSDGHTGPFTDIYALAATLYLCVTGSMPLPAVRRLTDPLTPASQVAAGNYRPGLLAGIDAGLALKAAKRPTSIEAWREILDSNEPTAAPAPELTVTPIRDGPVAQPAAGLSKRRDAGRGAIGGRRGRRRVAYATLAMVVVAGGLVGGGAFGPAPQERSVVEQTQQDASRRATAEAAAAQERAAAEAAAAQERATAEAARQRAEEQARVEAEAKRRVTEESARAETAARQKAEADTKARVAEAEAGRKAGEETRRLADERARTDAEARRRAETDAKRKAEDEVRRAAEERERARAGAKRQAEAEAGRKTENEARRVAEERARAEAEAKRQAEVEARRKSEDEARRVAEERARAEAEAKRQAEAEARRKSEDEARRVAEERARAEADARRQAEAEARRKSEDEARRVAEERVRAEADVKRQAEAEAKRKVEEETRRLAEERARADAEAQRQANREPGRVGAETRRVELADRQSAEDDARSQLAARQKAEAARRQAADETRAAAQEKARTAAEARRQGEAAERGLRLSAREHRRVQVALTSLGYDTHGIDEVFGPRTRQMIAAWQKKEGVPDTGFLTAPQVAALQRQAVPALAKYDAEEKQFDDMRRKAEEAAGHQGSPPAKPMEAAAPPAKPMEAAAPPPKPTDAAAPPPKPMEAAATSGNPDTPVSTRQEQYRGSGRMPLYGGSDPNAFAEYTLALTVTGQTISGVVTRYCPVCGVDGGEERKSFECTSTSLRAERFSLRCDGIFAWGNLQLAKVHYSSSGIEIPLVRVSRGG